MRRSEITRGAGNVFADLGLPDAEEHAVKADLVVRIAKIISEEQVTRIEAAKRFGVSQPEISKILKGQFRPYSIYDLILMLTKLGRDVTIQVVEPKKVSSKPGSITVEDARSA